MRFAFLVIIFLSFSISVFAGDARNIGIQTFTFSKLTIEELLPLVKQCGCDAVGMSRHRLSKKFPDVFVSPDMTTEQKEFLKKILSENKIKVVSYGVVTPTNEKSIRKLFEFAKEFDVKIILAEPRPEKLELWNKLCGEYNMKVAVHNHAKNAKRNPEFYNPKFVADMIAKYPNVYACADTGHWGRSGIDCVQGIKTLKDKHAILHFRDINKSDLSAFDVPIGTGALNAKQMLAELDSQNFNGYLLLEYGGWWKNTLEQKIEEVKKSVKFIKEN
ncbi:MAG: sugar phosphate isomerase/epimerase [Opitutales bacterium]|nr:sugar phosphate isomerase/epimerase [Opitutales bacterium]